MKARADQAHTVIIGEARSPVGVSLGLRLIGDEEVATVTITQRNKTTTLAFTDSAHAARIADALLGFQPYAVVVSRKAAEGERPPAPAVQGEPVGEVRFELGAPSSIFAELYSKSLPALAPGTKLYAAPQPAEQQPDVAQLVEALRMLVVAGSRLNDDAEECTHDDGMAEVAGSECWCEFRDALEAADAALAAYRKGGEV